MPVGRMRAFAKRRSAGDTAVPERRRMSGEHLTEFLSEIGAMRRSVDALQAQIEYLTMFTITWT